MALVSPLAFTCWLEKRVSARDEVFVFWGQALALVPGLPGSYIRRAFYAWTIRSCPSDCVISFLAIVHDRRAELGSRTYLGAGTTVGFVKVGAGSSVASRVSLLSGSQQHEISAEGRLVPFDRATRASPVSIGEETWIGEGAIIMADVGPRCIVGAGSVVSRPVPDGMLVAGNPAKIIRQVFPPPEA